MQHAPTNKGLTEHDPDAWAAFYDRHVRDIWRFLYRRTRGCRTAADDLTSETFLAAVESIDAYDADAGTLSQWLFGIARHKLASHLRKRVRLRLVGEPLETLPAPTTEPAYDHERIRSVLADLPPSQRDVLTWMYHDGLSVRQIAERVNRTEKAVENLLYRARLRFRSRYEAVHPMRAVP